MAGPLHVLFLCTGNSARSILAECLLARIGGGRFAAFSAGSQPKGAVHPLALALLRDAGFDVSGLRSKSWDEFSGPGAPRLDFVFTVCDRAAQEACPLWPGQPIVASWAIADPAAVVGPREAQERAFRRAYVELEARIRLFANLPFASLDRLRLTAEVERIGKLPPSA
jgi:arsenate reductase